MISFARRCCTNVKIKASEYHLRQSKLIDLIRKEKSSQTPITVVVPGSKISYCAPDVPHNFRQCSYFRYLCGGTFPEAKLIITADADSSNHKSILFLKDETEHDYVWHGKRIDNSVIKEEGSLDEILPLSEYEKFLHSRTKSTFGFDVNGDFDDTERKIFLQGVSRTTVSDKLDELRWIKSNDEISLIRKTCEIGSSSMNSVIKKATNINHENVFVGLLEYEMRRRGGDCLAYPPVVGAGERSNIIHYLDANKPIKPADCVLIDAGCDYEGYSSDITRCFPISGSFTPIQKALYDALDEVHIDCLDYCNTSQPLLLSDLYFYMLKKMSQYFTELQLFKNSYHTSEEILHIVNDICPHHISHYLGLDVHDSPTVKRNIPLVDGVVFTIEPGVYITHDNEFVRDEFKGIGFRIEDDILYTKNGIENLTKSCVRDSKDIENIMNPSF
uniref:Probable Xaa-Pro aminopeptidase 3 (inferred by orthology to a human protein) n=1 Tax=Strongyloides venezuelensis TaxID=75913 RepID=A0A0K0FSJ4_STRVS